MVELQLQPIEKLLRVRSTAIAASADATPFRPPNAAGTLAYQHGTFALRKVYVGEDWRLERPDGVETIVNEARKVRVVFANVDIACDDDLKPKPRSRKGAGAERVCLGNLFGSLPEYAPEQPEGWATFYLMVTNAARRSSRARLSSGARSPAGSSAIISPTATTSTSTANCSRCMTMT
ncbi:MAG: hypothetical protein WCC90_16555 [Methylocella sp.]